MALLFTVKLFCVRSLTSDFPVALDLRVQFVIPASCVDLNKAEGPSFSDLLYQVATAGSERGTEFRFRNLV